MTAMTIRELNHRTIDGTKQVPDGVVPSLAGCNTRGRFRKIADVHGAQLALEGVQPGFARGRLRKSSSVDDALNGRSA